MAHLNTKDIKFDAEKRIRIQELYLSGCSYREINEKIGASNPTINKAIKNIKRTHRAALKVAKDKGRGALTDFGRIQLSKAGKKSCVNNRKFWTKPEQKFKELLNECGIGVKFPLNIKELLHLEDDENAKVFFQYPLQRYVCDFVDLENKVVYAVNGDFWHANPLFYKGGLTAIQKNNIHHDIQRTRYLTQLGYQVCVLWENEINHNKELVKAKIQATRKMANPSGLHPEDTRIVTEVAYFGC